MSGQDFVIKSMNVQRSLTFTIYVQQRDKWPHSKRLCGRNLIVQFGFELFFLDRIFHIILGEPYWILNTISWTRYFHFTLYHILVWSTPNLFRQNTLIIKYISAIKNSNYFVFFCFCVCVCNGFLVNLANVIWLHIHTRAHQSFSIKVKTTEYKYLKIQLTIHWINCWRASRKNHLPWAIENN